MYAVMKSQHDANCVYFVEEYECIECIWTGDGAPTLHSLHDSHEAAETLAVELNKRVSIEENA